LRDRSKRVFLKLIDGLQSAAAAPVRQGREVPVAA
jgi:hypothetical protein